MENEIINAMLVFLMMYCLIKFITTNYELYRAQKFLEDPENGKLLLAMMKYVNWLCELRGKTQRVPEIQSLEEFYKLNKLDKDLISYSIKIILEDKQYYIEFFKERGDI